MVARFQQSETVPNIPKEVGRCERKKKGSRTDTSPRGAEDYALSVREPLAQRAEDLGASVPSISATIKIFKPATHDIAASCCDVKITYWFADHTARLESRAAMDGE